MERALLVGLRLPHTKKRDLDISLHELSRLAETAGAFPEITIVQSRPRMDPAYLIGRGKADEIAALIREKGVSTVIFDEELKPVQQRNLEERIGAKIIDRTRLILDIFARRARSREGILQVERAQLAYYLPRLTKQGVMLDSQVGGIGTRGPGERKLEVDQRRIRDRIVALDRGIGAVREHRAVLRQKRAESGLPIVAIAGYTNAGKSSLLNRLSASDEVYADDKLFATLDPTTRLVRLPGDREALFTDTVGFISKLPHTLVAAFRATLEEITKATCILHVIDVSHPDFESQIKTVNTVLRELEADEIPLVCVYNKADLLSIEKQHVLEQQGYLLLSVKTGRGIRELLEKIEDTITPRLAPHRMLLSYEQSGMLARIRRWSVVKEQEYTAQGIQLALESTPEQWERIQSLTRTNLKSAKGGARS
jgi:GTPase